MQEARGKWLFIRYCFTLWFLYALLDLLLPRFTSYFQELSPKLLHSAVVHSFSFPGVTKEPSFLTQNKTSQSKKKTEKQKASSKMGLGVYIPPNSLLSTEHLIVGYLWTHWTLWRFVTLYTAHQKWRPATAHTHLEIGTHAVPLKER